MVRFEGERDFDIPQGELFAKLSDARFLVECVPDRESVTSLAPDKAEMVIRPNLGFITGTLKVKLNIKETAAPTTVVVELSSAAIGASCDVRATLQLAAKENGTKLSWLAEVIKLTGLLKLAPHGLIGATAEKVIKDALDRVAEKANRSA